MIKRILFLILFAGFFMSAASQNFQQNFRIAGNHFHEVFTEQLQDGSDDLLIAGNFFDPGFSAPLMEVARFDDISGSLQWHFMYYDPTSDFEDVRIFDMTRFDGNLGEMIAMTGSLKVNDTNYMFIVRADDNGNFVDGAYYRDLIPAAVHSQGLNIISTQNGFAVGGFTNMDYDPGTADSTTGFIMRADSNLFPLWTRTIFTGHANASFDYDMVSDITETDDGYFVTGSVTCLPFFTQQGVLGAKFDFNGNLMWTSSYVYGNSRDVGVDAYYDDLNDEIYLLANYSASHYFGVTVIDDNSGTIDPARSWRAYDWNNLDRYGFSIMPANDTGHLVVAGYIRSGSYVNQYNTTVTAESLPFSYEFNKATGDQADTNYFYHVPYTDPGFTDYFDFWNSQMPLIYYPEMGLKLQNSDGYFLAGLRTDSLSGNSEAEMIITDSMHLNYCYRSPLVLQHDPIQPNPVPTSVGTSTPFKEIILLVNVPFDHELDSSCQSIPPPPAGCSCDSLAKDVADGFSYTVSALQLDVKPNSLDAGCDSVEWDWGDLHSSTSQGNNPVSHTYLFGGGYLVCMKVTRYASDGSVCRDSICYDIAVPGGVGIPEHEDDLHIWPVPAQDQLHIRLKDASGMPEYSLYNMLGLRVADGRIESPAFYLDVSSYSTGIYTLKIDWPNKSLSRKILIR